MLTLNNYLAYRSTVLVLIHQLRIRSDDTKVLNYLANIRIYIWSIEKSENVVLIF